MANAVYYETFPDIYRFMDTINRRANNDKFGTSSQKKSTDGWSGSVTYAEAVDMFSHGLPDVCEKMQCELKTFAARANIVTNKRTPQRYYYGYAPNIPAAIIGLPKSMYRIHKTPQKTKTIGILFDSSQNCSTDAETLRNAGEAVLKLVYMLERAGYRVQLDIIPFCTEDSNREFIAVVNLKQYSQHMDILKLSFPVTSPAMFRRFGFKWAEGIPGIRGDKAFCYGSHIDKNALIATLGSRGYDTKSAYCIGVDDCTSADFNPFTIAENIGITL